MYGNYNYQPWMTPGIGGAAFPQPQPMQPNRFQAPPPQPMMQPPQGQFDNMQRPPLQGVAWVNGLIGAQAYLIAPNTSVMLMDSDGPFFYIKTSDMSGKADVKQFRYAEEQKAAPAPVPVEAPAPAPTSTYVTKEEFEQFKASLTYKPIKRAERSEEVEQDEQ